MNAFTKIQRGYDSSGRALFATAMNWQHYDRVNDLVGGVLVTVQGSWSDADASANTHGLAGCRDLRTWNLTTDQRNRTIRAARDPELVGHAAAFYRTLAQGFDPHIHWILMGDSPLTSSAAQQIVLWKQGYNALANMGRDDFPYRPPTFTPYQYIEDDMTPEERQELFRIGRRLDAFASAERTRDQKERERDKERFSRVVTELGKNADFLGSLAASAKDAETKTLARKRQAEILQYLKDDPDVTGVDNPSDEALAERGL